MEIRDLIRGRVANSASGALLSAGLSAGLFAGLLAGLLACQSSPSGEVASTSARSNAKPAALSAARESVRLGRVPELRTPRGRLQDECARRRVELAQQVGGPCVIWVVAAPANDLTRFVQQDDFYYLSGVEIPDIALALQVDASGALVDEVLFLPPHDAFFETWNGKRLSPGPEAERATGFRSTAPLDEQFDRLETWKTTVVHALGGTPSQPAGLTISDGVLLRTTLDTLRLTKSDYEIDCLANAIQITTSAMVEAMAAVEPGAYEYQAQGLLEGAFLRLGSEQPGFTSIVGSGPNSVTLHYNSNRRQMQDGELMVMDVGARWRYYTADVTRTVPVNGRFTPRQREVYQIVLDAQTAAFEAARPGITMAELDAIARQVIVERGFGPARKYFKHGLGHWIGLYVHDVGEYGPIEPGMLFTIEPGIYIDEEQLGVRIEDDYLMTETGAVKLSTGFPSDPDAVEALLAGT